MAKKNDEKYASESIGTRLRKYKPIDSVLCDKIANSKATQPCYIDLYKTMHKVECIFEGLKEIADKIEELENKITNES